MSLDRRELLGSLGIASASTLLWAMGCGGATRPVRSAPEVSDEIRTWLRDAVERLAVAFSDVHVLAVVRQRTTAAVDVLGSGVARARRDGVVLAVRDRDGIWREQVTGELSETGVAAAVRALIGSSRQRAPIQFPAPPPRPTAPPVLVDPLLRDRVLAIGERDRRLDSRIVYAASMIDVDDAHVWSISPAHDREQRLVRVRKRATRAAWNGQRPVVSEIVRGWRGGIDDGELSAAEVEQATEDALLLLTPGAFEDGVRTVVVDPSVAASLIDAGVRALLTSTAAGRPEVARRLRRGSELAATRITLTDDPGAPGAYGGFAFDDEGAPAAPLRLIEDGRVVAVLADRATGGGGRGRRPGHVGTVEPAPSHLRMSPGTEPHGALRGDGLILEGALGAVVDPSTDRIVIGAARARELRGGVPTGRVHGDVELVGELSALLASVDALASDTATIPYRDEVAGEPRWRSIEAPHLRTRGLVRARRRRA